MKWLMSNYFKQTKNSELFNDWKMIKDGKYKIIGQEKERKIHLLAFTHLKIGEIDEWIEYEITTDWMKFIHRKEKILEETIKRLKNKIRHIIRVKRENKKTNEIINALPDNTIITIEDSINAGICMSGTKRFIKNNFPDKEKVKAKKLKKFTSSAVQRVLLKKAEKVIPEKVNEIKAKVK